MGNYCIQRMKDTFDFNGDGRVDTQDYKLVVQDALITTARVAAHMKGLMEFLKKAGMQCAEEGQHILETIENIARGTVATASTLDEVTVPYQLRLYDNDTALEWEYFCTRECGSTVEKAIELTSKLGKLIQQMENIGVDLGPARRDLARVQAILARAYETRFSLTVYDNHARSSRQGSSSQRGFSASYHPFKPIPASQQLSAMPQQHSSVRHSLATASVESDDLTPPHVPRVVEDIGPEARRERRLQALQTSMKRRQ